MQLTPTPPADSYRESALLDKAMPDIPLDLYLCEQCGNTQLGHVIDAEEVYLNYIYETASTLGLGEHFAACAETIFNDYGPKAGDLVLDIGSNDGILLKHFQDKGLRVIGIDPMPGIAEKAASNGVETIEAFFNADTAASFARDVGLADIVCCNNLVADTDDLQGFIDALQMVMKESSIFFFETFYFFLQVQNNNWDFTYHEHYSYLTVTPLKAFFEANGMEIINVETNPTKGGSMRVVVQKQGGKFGVSASVNSYIAKEKEAGFHTYDIFRRYQSNVEKSKEDFRKVAEELIADGKKVVGYGASATGTTLMHHFDMKHLLAYLVDDFEAKQGLYSPGFNLPVFHPSKIYEDQVDVVVILAWRYKDKIMAKHKEFLGSGGQFLVPLPSLELITN